MNRLILLLLFPLFMGVGPDQTTILETKVTMKVYPAEILESVINRLHADTGKPIEYSTLMLLPYMAKAADYKNTTVKAILEEQLQGTPLTYRINKKILTICLKINGTD